MNLDTISKERDPAPELTRKIVKRFRWRYHPIQTDEERQVITYCHGTRIFDERGGYAKTTKKGRALLNSPKD